MLKVGDFSRLSLVSIKALRYYDELALLKPARVVHIPAQIVHRFRGKSSTHSD